MQAHFCVQQLRRESFRSNVFVSLGALPSSCLAKTAEHILFQCTKVWRTEPSHWVPSDSGVPVSTRDDTRLFSLLAVLRLLKGLWHDLPR
jgi:hypothetical protein